MPPTAGDWESLPEEKWDNLVRMWLACVREDNEDTADAEVWHDVVLCLGHWGPPELLWKFIKLALSLAESKRELDRIASGPIVDLLGRNGEQFMDALEEEAAVNPRLAEAMRSCDRSRFNDEIWQRLKQLP